MASLPQDIIRRKRDGEPLDDADIAGFIGAFTRGDVTGEQAAAFAMAVFFRGMTRGECVALTRAMTRSGTVLDWRGFDLKGPLLDKHSTGGIGDNVSLILAPALAACGALVPMISGRGLGHTGGTLDKLDAIPGYRTTVAVDELQRIVAEVGCAIVGASADLAPADARLYAIRDVTATVESVPLIIASILSKKGAAGLDALVMDVKTGSGAFMASHEEARALAESLVAVANGAGLKTAALITAMDQPLADAAGNAVEVRHALDHLTGVARDPRVETLVNTLGGTLLALGGLAPDEAEGARRIERAVADGRAAEWFARMVAALGGPADMVERPDRHLPQAAVERDVFAASDGVVASIAARRIGLAVVALGGGRTRPGGPVDPSVGFARLAGIGTRVGPSGRPLGRVLARTAAEADRAADALRQAYEIGEAAGPALPAIIERV